MDQPKFQKVSGSKGSFLEFMVTIVLLMALVGIFVVVSWISRLLG